MLIYDFTNNFQIYETYQNLNKIYGFFVNTPILNFNEMELVCGLYY